MPLPSSGPIRLGADVNVELGLGSTTQISMGSASVRGLFGTAAGAVRLTADGYGKSSIISGTQQGSKLVGTGWIGMARIGRNVNGVSISADGNTAAVGGSDDNDSIGAAMVFTRSAGVWIQQSIKLIGTGGLQLPKQGFSTALSADGNRLFVGGPYDDGLNGAVWQYTRSGSTWTQQGSKITATGGVLGPTSPQRRIGLSMALSSDGTTLAVGGQYNAWIFTNSGGNTWTQQASVNNGTSDPAIQFGSAVSISSDGNTLAVGQSFLGSTGAVFIYTRSGATWTLQQQLIGSGGVGTAQSQGRSCSLSADGNTVVIGGLGDSSQTGAVWTFTRSGSTWTQLGSKLVSPTTQSNFGQCVSLSADGIILAIGSPGNPNFSFRGAMSIYKKSSSTWTPIVSNIMGTGFSGSPEFGDSLALSSDGRTLIVGGNADSSFLGAAWIFI